MQFKILACIRKTNEMRSENIEEFLWKLKQISFKMEEVGTKKCIKIGLKLINRTEFSFDNLVSWDQS